MSELIRREDAIKATWQEPSYTDPYNILTEVRDRIIEIPAAQRWHSMEQSEPTKEGWYLVMDVDGDFNVDEWHNTFGWQFITTSDADRITHWMPIEPPKEDEHGN
jgi:hypothetical protein